jgi:hypothetical protein
MGMLNNYGQGAQSFADNFMKTYLGLQQNQRAQQEQAMMEKYRQAQEAMMQEQMAAAQQKRQQEAAEISGQMNLRGQVNMPGLMQSGIVDPVTRSSDPVAMKQIAQGQTPQGLQLSEPTTMQRVMEQVRTNPTEGLKSLIALSGKESKEPPLITALRAANANGTITEQGLALLNQYEGGEFHQAKKDKVTETWSEPYEMTVGGKKGMVQKSSHGQIRPVMQDVSTTINMNSATPDQVNILARGIIDKTIDPNGISKRGGLQAAVWSKVKELEPSFDVVKAGAGAAFEKNPGAMSTKALLNAIDPLLSSLVTAGEKLTDTGSPILNAPMQWAQKNVLPGKMGGVEVTAFDNLRDDTIAEVERGLLNTGVLSDTKYIRAVKNLNTAQTQAQRVAAVENIKLVIRARLEALESGPYKDREVVKPQKANTPRFTIKKVN